MKRLYLYHRPTDDRSIEIFERSRYGVPHFVVREGASHDHSTPSWDEVEDYRNRLHTRGFALRHDAAASG